MGKVHVYLFKGKKVFVFHVLFTPVECEHRKAIYFVSGNPCSPCGVMIPCDSLQVCDLVGCSNH